MSLVFISPLLLPPPILVLFVKVAARFISQVHSGDIIWYKNYVIAIAHYDILTNTWPSYHTRPVRAFCCEQKTFCPYIRIKLCNFVQQLKPDYMKHRQTAGDREREKQLQNRLEAQWYQKDDPFKDVFEVRNMSCLLMFRLITFREYY